jgi:hypothetical protein
MATIVHRRYAAPRAAAPVEPHAPDARLDQLTWFGWASAVLAVATLIIQLMPLTRVDAFAENRLLEQVMTVLRSVSASAPLALVAALELGLPNARARAPWLWRGVLLYALGQALLFGLQQLSDRFLSGQDFADPTNPWYLILSVAALAMAILQIGGLWSMSDGLGDLGARPGRSILVGLPVIAMLGTAIGYVSLVVQSGLEGLLAGGVLTFVALLRVAALVATAGLLVAVGVRLVTGAIDRLPARRAWITGAIAGGSLIGFVLLQALRVQRLGDLAYAAAVLTLVLEMLGWVLLVSALAGGLGRAALIRVAPRRFITRWVRYPAA